MNAPPPGQSASKLSGRSSEPDRHAAGSRRQTVLAFSILLLAGGVGLRVRGGDSALAFASTSMLRIGLVLGMLWLAWPSLRRPSQWLAPGISVVIVVTLVVIAANPRLALVAIPLAGGMITLGTLIRAFRSSRKR